MTAAALDHRPPPDPRLLRRCLLLAVLLHVWLVLVFGNTTGVAEPGQGVWGSLTVKLLGRSGGDAGAPPGDAAQRQPQQTSPTAPPGAAAKPGRWNPREVPAEAAPSDEVSPAAPSTATLALPEGFRPIERQDLSPPPRPAPLQVPAPELPSAAVGRLDSRPDDLARPLPPAASLRAPSRAAAELPPQPAELPAPVNRLDNVTPRPGAVAALPRPAELRPTPAVPVSPGAELPPPVSRLEAPATPSVATPLPRPAELRTAPSRSAAPDVQATPLPAPVQRLEAADTGPAAVTPLTRPSELRPPGNSSATAPTALPNRQDLPAAVQRLEPAEVGNGITPLQPPAGARASLPASASATLGDLSGGLPGQVAAPAGPAHGDPNASPLAAPRASPGTPDAGSRPGPDLPSPPSAAASAARAPLNLSLPRGGDIASRRGPGLVDLLPPPPERKSKLEQSLEDAANKDCRKAYAGAGLLAVVPLAVDAVRGKGCKW